MSKKLTLADIKNQIKVYEQKQRIELSDDFHLFIYPHFSPSKIGELIKEMVTDPQRAKDAGIDFDEINMGDWFLFNVIYKFADLGIPSEIKKKVQAFSYLVDSEFFGKIIDSFPQESIHKIEESFNNFQENFNAILQESGYVPEDKIDELIEVE
jgi:hypothetical protein